MWKLLMGCLCIGRLCAIDLGAHLLQNETTIAQYFQPLVQSPIRSHLNEIDCIYVLNLEKRSEKWEDTQEVFKPYQLGLTRFIGIDGWSIPSDVQAHFWEEQKDALIDDGQTLYSLPKSGFFSGNLGSTLSHLSILQDAYDRGYQVIWLLEDDVSIKKDPHLLDETIQRLNAVDPSWDLLYTDLQREKSPATNEQDTSKPSLTKICRKNQQIMPTHWYFQKKDIDAEFEEVRLRYGFYSVLLSRSGIKKILDYYKHVTLYCSFDLDVHFVENLHKYALKDPIVTNNSNWLLSDPFHKTDSLSHLPAPFKELHRILPYSFQQRSLNEIWIQELISKYQPQVAIAVGNSIGGSIYPLGRHLPENGKFYVINEWEEDQIFDQFLSNVIHEHLVSAITPVNSSFKDVKTETEQLKISPSFVYLDSSVGKEKLYEQLCKWYEVLIHHGMLCFDDFSWAKDPSLEKVVNRFSKKHHVKILFPNYKLWVIMKRD